MAGTRAAVRYAKAVLDLANTQNIAPVINADMLQIANAVKESTELRSVLQNDVITSETKKGILLKLFPNANAIVTNLFDVLVTNKRVNILEEIASKFTELFDKSQNIEIANVTTAVPLTEALENKILAKVKELTNAEKIEVNNTVDESILGGFILRVGDIQYNASIANQLNKLKKEFIVN